MTKPTTWRPSNASGLPQRNIRRVVAVSLALCATMAPPALPPAQALIPPPPPSGKFGCIDRHGGFVVPPIYDHIDTCSGPIIAVRLGGLEGFVGDKGQAVLPVTLRTNGSSTMSSAFEHGLEPVEQAGYSGYINARGQFVIAAKLLGADRFGSSGHAHVLLQGADGTVERALIDTSGAYVIAPRKDWFSDLAPNGLARVSENGLHPFGYMDKSGVIRIPEHFDVAGTFNASGLALVDIGGRWGYIDANGTFVIPAKYDQAMDFGRWAPRGLAAVVLDGRQLFIDRHGRTVATLDPGMKVFANFSHGLAQSGFDNMDVGFVDEHGRTVIQPKFDAESDFSANGTAAAKLAGKWGFIDRKGRFVIQPQFEGARAFAANGLASVAVGKKLGYIDRRGKLMIAPRFDNAGSFGENGLALVEVGRPESR